MKDVLISEIVLPKLDSLIESKTIIYATKFDPKSIRSNKVSTILL